MSTAIPDLRCALCSSETIRVKVHAIRDLYDVDCPSCGRYRTKSLAEAFFRFATSAQQRGVIQRVRAANERGQFIRLGSLQVFPLSEWAEHLDVVSTP